MIEEFSGFLKIADAETPVTIEITHLFDDDVTLLFKDKNNRIGGHFTVSSEEIGAAKYNICEFTELLFWCVGQGLTVSLNGRKIINEDENKIAVKNN